MINFSQEKKIAISVLAIFIISFSVMALVLQKDAASSMHASVTNASSSSSHGGEQASTAGSHSAGASAEKAEVKEENPYAKYVTDEETPFFILNSSGEIEYSNENFCEFMEIKCEELKNKVFFEYINSEDLVKLVSEYTKVIHDQKETFAIGPYRLNAKSDEKIVLFDVLPIMSAENGKVEKLLFATNDITEKVEELKEKKEDKKEDKKEEEVKPLEHEEAPEKEENKEIEKTVGFHLNLIGKLF